MHLRLKYHPSKHDARANPSNFINIHSHRRASFNPNLDYPTKNLSHSDRRRFYNDFSLGTLTLIGFEAIKVSPLLPDTK